MHAGPRLHLVFIVKGRVPEQQAVGLQLPGQVFLGQRWPLIGQVRFFTDQDEPALEPFTPKGFHRRGPSLPGTHDCEGLVHGFDPILHLVGA